MGRLNAGENLTGTHSEGFAEDPEHFACAGSGQP
jgi:hypothetical protein